jgi:hypothetical protein
VRKKGWFMVAVGEMTGGSVAVGAAVVCRGVTKTYGEGSSAVYALRGVDLTVGKGELMWEDDADLGDRGDPGP